MSDPTPNDDSSFTMDSRTRSTRRSRGRNRSPHPNSKTTPSEKDAAMPENNKNITEDPKALIELAGTRGEKSKLIQMMTNQFNEPNTPKEESTLVGRVRTRKRAHNSFGGSSESKESPDRLSTSINLSVESKDTITSTELKKIRKEVPPKKLEHDSVLKLRSGTRSGSDKDSSEETDMSEVDDKNLVKKEIDDNLDIKTSSRLMKRASRQNEQTTTSDLKELAFESRSRSSSRVRSTDNQNVSAIVKSRGRPKNKIPVPEQKEPQKEPQKELQREPQKEIQNNVPKLRGRGRFGRGRGRALDSRTKGKIGLEFTEENLTKPEKEDVSIPEKEENIQEKEEKQTEKEEKQAEIEDTDKIEKPENDENEPERNTVKEEEISPVKTPEPIQTLPKPGKITRRSSSATSENQPNTSTDPSAQGKNIKKRKKHFRGLRYSFVRKNKGKKKRGSFKGMQDSNIETESIASEDVDSESADLNQELGDSLNPDVEETDVDETQENESEVEDNSAIRLKMAEPISTQSTVEDDVEQEADEESDEHDSEVLKSLLPVEHVDERPSREVPRFPIIDESGAMIRSVSSPTFIPQNNVFSRSSPDIEFPTKSLAESIQNPFGSSIFSGLKKPMGDVDFDPTLVKVTDGTPISSLEVLNALSDEKIHLLESDDNLEENESYDGSEDKEEIDEENGNYIHNDDNAEDVEMECETPIESSSEELKLHLSLDHDDLQSSFNYQNEEDNDDNDIIANYVQEEYNESSRVKFAPISLNDKSLIPEIGDKNVRKLSKTRKKSFPKSTGSKSVYDFDENDDGPDMGAFIKPPSGEVALEIQSPDKETKSPVEMDIPSSIALKPDEICKETADFTPEKSASLENMADVTSKPDIDSKIANNINDGDENKNSLNIKKVLDDDIKVNSELQNADDKDISDTKEVNSVDDTVNGIQDKAIEEIDNIPIGEAIGDFQIHKKSLEQEVSRDLNINKMTIEEEATRNSDIKAVVSSAAVNENMKINLLESKQKSHNSAQILDEELNNLPLSSEIEIKKINSESKLDSSNDSPDIASQNESEIATADNINTPVNTTPETVEQGKETAHIEDKTPYIEKTIKQKSPDAKSKNYVLAIPSLIPLPDTIINGDISEANIVRDGQSQEGRAKRKLREITDEKIEESAQKLKKSSKRDSFQGVVIAAPRSPEVGGDGAAEPEGSQSSYLADPKLTNILCKCVDLNNPRAEYVPDIIYCQAIDSFNGRMIGCCNKVSDHRYLRVSGKIPFMLFCNHHAMRLHYHNCCPGCGLFCTQGIFYECRWGESKVRHHYHKLCGLPGKGEGSPMLCPHCGTDKPSVEVHLELKLDRKPVIYLKQHQEKKGTNARMSWKSLKNQTTSEEITNGTETDLEIKGELSLSIGKGGGKLSTANVPLNISKEKIRIAIENIQSGRVTSHKLMGVLDCPRSSAKAMYYACKNEDIEKLLNLLMSGMNPNLRVKEQGNQTGLHIAASQGSLLALHILVMAKANLDLTDADLNTPLMTAIMNEKNKVVLYLVQAGASLQAKTKDGMTALHLAAKTGSLQACQHILNSGRLSKNAINDQDEGGWTPLVWACENKYTNIVKYLLECGGNPLLCDVEQNTALHWAAFSGSTLVCGMMLDRGCSLHSMNVHGDTPLHIAARRNNTDVAVLLLSRGASIDVQNKKNLTPNECALPESDIQLQLSLNYQIHTALSKNNIKVERIISSDIAAGKEQVPIPCVNAVDEEDLKGGYLYIAENCEALNVNINRTIGSLKWCNCEDGCNGETCECGQLNFQCWYDSDGRLLSNFNYQDPPMIFECNRACGCNKLSCNNRVVQHGITAHLQLFRTEGKGWGVRTMKTIPKGSYVCEYVGEIITDLEADQRQDDSYLFDLDNRDSETYCIDARSYGNVARFINHLCKPNLTPVKLFIDHQDLVFPRIAFFANRDIEPDEELGFDYGEKFWIIKYKHFTCGCGLEECKYSAEKIQATLDNYNRRLQEIQMAAADI